jgi:dienelactone hydrolase
LLFDLLTMEEDADRANVFIIPLLAERLVQVVRWLGREPTVGGLPLGLFGAGTGAAAALVAAAQLGNRVGAAVSRGGRPDLAGDALDQIHTPTLLIVGGIDFGVIELNEQRSHVCMDRNRWRLLQARATCFRSQARWKR